LREAIFTHPAAAKGLIAMFASPLIDPERN